MSIQIFDYDARVTNLLDSLDRLIVMIDQLMLDNENNRASLARSELSLVPALSPLPVEPFMRGDKKPNP